MAKPTAASSTTAPTCASCRCEIGTAAKQVPFAVPEDDGEGGAKVETFCPRCFVFVRAPKSPLRFFSPHVSAIQCSACGCASVHLGPPMPGSVACGQCGSRHILFMAPGLLVSA